MIQAVKGAKDLTPDVIDQWYYVENIFRKVSESFGYKELRTPIFEKTEVFSRGVGEGTDIVNKEMYTFIDKGNESITLRPEMTAALVRSVIQEGIINQGNIARLWYFGPFFRYERPQKGRLRQFHQYGAECLASPHPESDAEIILLAHATIKALGIEEYELMLNTLGNEESRENYRKALVEYLTAHRDQLSGDSQNRMDANPLRVLDSKHPDDKLVVENAPVIIDYLDEESKAHFEAVKSILTDAGIKISLTPKLVRGLDYYCHTVFEFRSTALGAQDSFGGGGRYNGLIAQLGGKDAPAVGFAMGVERLLLILESLGKLPATPNLADVYVISTSDKYSALALRAADIARAQGAKVMVDLQRRSMKAQMREANKLGANQVIIIGDQEALSGTVQIKNMHDSSQSEVPFDKLAGFKF